MRVRAVVFDLDGVLVDSTEVMREAFQRAYHEVVGPGPAPFAEYLTHLGRHMPDTLRRMGLPAELYPPFVRISNELVSRVKPCDGADALLDGLRDAGVALAVATGKTHDRAERVLEAVGLRDRLDVVAGSDQVARGKPAPDLVALALAQLRVAPDGAVMVGDSALDLSAGRAAGTTTAAALWGQGSRADLLACQPDLVATSCADLASMLGRVSIGKAS